MSRYMMQLTMVKTFRDQWLDDYYLLGVKSPNIPGTCGQSKNWSVLIDPADREVGISGILAGLKTKSKR